MSGDEHDGVDPKFPFMVTMTSVAFEVRRAREKFPRDHNLVVALMEEVGELAKEALQNGTHTPAFKGEAKQVAAVAMRLMEEGDSIQENVPEDQRKP